MSADFINIGLAFIEGILLIASPCILPVLPIVLSGSLEGSKKRPFGIIVGFVITFSLLTYFSRSIVIYTGVDLTLVRYISYVLLILFGIVMMSTYLTEKFTSSLQRLANVGASVSTDPNAGFSSGLILGALIGIIWTPCAGPILAAVILQTVLQKTTITSFLVIVSFGLGAAIPMLLIALFGRSIMDQFKFFKTHAYLWRKFLGAIIVLSVFYMIYGETAAVSALTKNNSQTPKQLVNGISVPYAAPEIAGITAWINSPPLTIKELKGKVVLVDFWAFSCINCIRTLPYLNDWYQKYHDKGFVIVGVHSPEFEFERVQSNVENAVKKFGIHYPVALDNNFVTWQNFHNQFWPAHYLIDKNGNVVYQHFGEGEYDVTESNIRYLLGVAGDNTAIKEESVSRMITPETYLGVARANKFSSPEKVVVNAATQYTFPKSLSSDDWALNGSWIIAPEKITSAQAGASIKIHFYAKKLFIVMGSKAPQKVKLLLNGEQVINEKGSDVVNSEIQVKENRLYEVISFPETSSGILQVITSAPGLEIYTFTFG